MKKLLSDRGFEETKNVDKKADILMRKLAELANVPLADHKESINRKHEAIHGMPPANLPPDVGGLGHPSRWKNLESVNEVSEASSFSGQEP